MTKYYKNDDITIPDSEISNTGLGKIISINSVAMTVQFYDTKQIGIYELTDKFQNSIVPNHYPSGGDCIRCANMSHECAKLVFRNMRVIQKDKGNLFVKCSNFEKEAA